MEELFVVQKTLIVHKDQRNQKNVPRVIIVMKIILEWPKNHVSHVNQGIIVKMAPIQKYAHQDIFAYGVLLNQIRMMQQEGISFLPTFFHDFRYKNLYFWLIGQNSIFLFNRKTEKKFKEKNKDKLRNEF